MNAFSYKFDGGPLSNAELIHDFSRPFIDAPRSVRYPDKMKIEYLTIVNPENAGCEPSSPVAAGREVLTAEYEFDQELGCYRFLQWTLSPNPPIDINA